VDKDRFIPLRKELYAKSGVLLKRMELSDVLQIQGRWYPEKILFKDVLKEGDGTEFQMMEIEFNTKIPDYIFSKASLKK
jgi:outer membrane lipoprotein-sorting protein